MTTDDYVESIIEPYQMPEGYLGNLSEEHQEVLCQMWDAFFSICDKASGQKNEGATGFSEDWGVDEDATKKSSGGGGILGATKAVKSSGISKEDDAKAAAQARTEEANMERLLSTYGPEALRNAFWSLCKRDNPDIIMLRFLRARKWNVDHTTAMMASTLKWRLDTNLDHLVENGDLGNGKEIPKYIENFDENGKVFTLGTNHRNQPVMYVKFGKHIIWAQPQATTKKFIIAHFELVRLLVEPPNDKIVLLFDCTGFGPSNMDVINFLYILQCLQSYFPEQLSILYLHKAPWILQRAWHMVKWLLDPVVRAKVQFTNKAEELMEEIPREHLLHYIGGDVDVEFNWVPCQEDENDLHKDTAERKRRWDNHRRLCNEYEQVTRKWAMSGGREEDEKRKVLAKKIRVSHFDYEPYWQGLWNHHRNGDLTRENPGMIRWNYPLVDGSKKREIMGHRHSRKALVRELQEIAAGASVEFAERHTDEIIRAGQFGEWDSCDDLPSPPTDFRNGQLIYDNDGGAAASVDVIGLNGPESLEEARRSTNATRKQSEGQKTLVDPNEQSKTAMAAVPLPKAAYGQQDVHEIKAPSPTKTATRDVATSVKKKAAPPPAVEEKQSWFSSIKRKIAV